MTALRVRPEELDRFRVYLRLLARMHLRRCVQGRLDPSDVVQQTMLKAVERLPDFRGSTDAELASWLRQILVNELLDTVRRFARQKRDVERERSLEASLEQSSVRLEVWLADNHSSPVSRAERNEQLLALAAALEELLPDEREAVSMHYLLACSLKEVAAELGRTEGAVAGLIYRAMKKLKRRLRGEKEEPPIPETAP